MKKECCFNVSVYAHVLPLLFFMTLIFLTHNRLAIIVIGCAIIAYILLIMPFKVCIKANQIVIKNILGHNKRTINWSEIKSLSLSKTPEPALPLQVVIRFIRNEKTKRQSFGINSKGKTIELIKSFLSNNIPVISHGHKLVEDFIKQAKDENLD